MSVIGPAFCPDVLYLTRGRDWGWLYKLVDANDVETDFPPGRLYFEFATAPDLTEWDFVIQGSTASIRVQSEEVDMIPNRCRWQLVFLPEGEAAGGDPVALGSVQVQK